MICEIMVILTLVLFGTMLSLGKWSFLIAGFNTMSKEEKEKYDEKSLCKFMGKFIFIIVFAMILCLLGNILTIKILIVISRAIIITSAIFLIIYVNTGNRFKK